MPQQFVPTRANAGAHALLRARLPDGGGARAKFTGASTTRANARIARFLPAAPHFVGGSTAAAERRAKRFVDRTAPVKVVAGDAPRHAMRMARFSDSRA